MRKNDDGEYTRMGRKNAGGSWFAVAHNTTSGHGQNPVTREAARKAASAMIAKIPFPLAQHIARTFKEPPSVIVKCRTAELA